MTLTTFQIGAAVTPTVIKTGLSHYTKREPRHKKPTAHISYDQGLNVIRSFLSYVSHKTVEDLQSFTANKVPHASWVRTENVTIPEGQVNKAAHILIEQLGEDGVKQIGGRNWWQWRRKHAELKAEWIEMRAHYDELKATNKRSKRVMMYMHGGGYFFGSVDEHRYQIQRHARKLKARVIAPRYRLAPQFPFPCGLQDCLAVYLYLLTIHEPNEIILAGDSAGGGMVLTLMCILRDRSIPLPAGGILISPWVDLSSSFPSVSAENPLDYIPPQGFHQKPSVSWPPPSEDETKALARSTGVSDREQAFFEKSDKLAQKLTKPETAQVRDDVRLEKAEIKTVNPVLGPRHRPSVQIDGKVVILKEQFLMYTTNDMITHPLVSPALQPSLGGLPPLLVLTGGGEMLRDEQIYVAHKAANPAKYPLGEAYRSKYDPGDEILNKYKPSPVQLQVWEDLCHVAPTLSFTRPAKYMYRSVAQFGAWALARAQSTSIEIVDDDNISMISSKSRSSETDSTDSITAEKKRYMAERPRIVGRAGDPLPMFQNHMVRQRIDRYGNIYELAPPSELPATTMDPNDIGMLKPVPVKKWMHAKKQWDTKYASVQKTVQTRRLRDRAAALPLLFGPDENPPPSALAGRRTAQDEIPPELKKGHLLALWSGWGSKHDEHTIQREEKAMYEEKKQEQQEQKRKKSKDEAVDTVTPVTEDRLRAQTVPTNMSRARRRSSGEKQRPSVGHRSRSRRTMTVTDRGQVEGTTSDLTALPSIDPSNSTITASRANDSAILTPPPTSATEQTQHLGPTFVPKLKTVDRLRSPSHPESDAASMRSGVSFADNASTMAVFGAAGVSKATTASLTYGGRPITSATADSTGQSDKASTIRSPTIAKSADDGYDTPASRRSVERLQSHQSQQVEDGSLPSYANSMLSPDETKTDGARLQHLRSPSNVAIIGAAGIVDVIKGGQADPELQNDDGFPNGENIQAREDSPNVSGARLEHLRNPSNIAVVGAADVVDVVKGGEADGERQKDDSSADAEKSQPGSDPTQTRFNGTTDGKEAEVKETGRPGMYDRADSEFQTAIEKM